MITIKKDGSGKFFNELQALTAMTTLQLHYAQTRQSVTSRVNFNNKTIELSIYFNPADYVKDPYGIYSRKEITSHQFYLDSLQRVFQVRCMTFYFEY